MKENKPLMVGNAILSNRVITSLEYVQENHQTYLNYLSNIRNRLISFSFDNENLNLMEYMREIQLIESEIKKLANILEEE